MYCFLFSFFLPYSFFLVYHAWLPFLLSCPAPTGHLVHRPGSAALWFFVPGAEKCACPENPPAPLRPHRTPFIGVNRLPSGIASRSSCPALTGHLVHRPGSAALWFFVPGAEKCACPENPPAPLRPHRPPFIGVDRLPSGIASRSSCPALTGHLVHRPGSAALWVFVPGAEKCVCPENPPAPLRPHRPAFIGA